MIPHPTLVPALPVFKLSSSPPKPRSSSPANIYETSSWKVKRKFESSNHREQPLQGRQRCSRPLFEVRFWNLLMWKMLFQSLKMNLMIFSFNSILFFHFTCRCSNISQVSNVSCESKWGAMILLQLKKSFKASKTIVSIVNLHIKGVSSPIVARLHIILNATRLVSLDIPKHIQWHCSCHFTLRGLKLVEPTVLYS